MDTLSEYKNIFPRDMWNEIISNYYSSFPAIYENIINILPIIDKDIIFNIRYNIKKKCIKFCHIN